MDERKRKRAIEEGRSPIAHETDWGGIYDALMSRYGISIEEIDNMPLVQLYMVYEWAVYNMKLDRYDKQISLMMRAI